MAWWMFAAQMGMSLLQQGSSYGAAAAEARARRKLQEYNNKMSRISDALNQNAITTNVTKAIQASSRAAIALQDQVREITAAADVQAASTGTVGRSVDMVMNEISRGAAQQEYTRQEDLKAYFLQADQQRKQSALSAKLNQDNSYIPKPSAASALFNVGMDAMGFAKQNGVDFNNLTSLFSNSKPAFTGSGGNGIYGR